MHRLCIVLLPEGRNPSVISTGVVVLFCFKFNIVVVVIIIIRLFSARFSMGKFSSKYVLCFVAFGLQRVSSLTQQYCGIMSMVWSGNHNVVSPAGLHSAFGNVHGQFKNFLQVSIHLIALI